MPTRVVEEILQPLSVQEHLQRIAVSLFFVFLSSWIAYALNFFRFPKEETLPYRLSFKTLIAVFALLFAVVTIIVPLFYQLWNHMGELSSVSESIPTVTQGWLNVSVVVLTATALAVFYRTRSPEIRSAVWWDSSLHPGEYRNSYLIGALTWLVAYPYVMFIDQVVDLFSVWFYFVQKEQVAVNHLRMTMEHRSLFLTMVLLIIAVVPVVEEMIFRGFLQNFLKARIGRGIAIAITSIIFSLFHFSSSQGVTNIKLLISLFVLSCFLGFIYERQQSLWASIGLHTTFNGISVLAIVLGD